MKKIGYLLLFLSHQCFAQHEADIWYFGDKAGIDFSSGSPVALTNCSSSFSAFEGVGTLSDHDGNLLFYTDGYTVFNANHVAMPNGTGLFSNNSSTQTGLSVKQPGSDSLYWVFHINLFPNTLYYSTVDMSLNGGLGDVVDKNVVLRTNTTEKVTAVNHANGTDIWIITHDYNSTTFAAYLLSSTGLNTTPVISNIGPYYTSDIGYLKASPNGDRLASADFYMNTYSLYDFDNSTGAVSNPLQSPADYVYAYGCEWSPDGTKLYGGAENTNKLWQFDVSAGVDVWTTVQLIYQTSSQEFEALQLGPDGKIYCSRYQTAYLGVINSPDSAGSACDYVENGVDLLGRVCYLGLPNYNMSYFTSQLQTEFAASSTHVCQKFCIDFYDSTLNSPTSWQWSFPGGSPNTSSLQNPTNICYNLPGTYDVTLVTSNGTQSDSLTLVGYVTVNPTPPFPDITQNDYTLTSSTATTYQWQLNSEDIPGATDQSYEVMQTGFYTVIISDENGCVSSSTLYVEITGIDELSDANISIYPNPSDGNFTVQFLNETVGKEVSIEVINALGQRVYLSQKNISSSNLKQEIDLSKLPTGVYYLTIQDENDSLNRKIILHH